MKKVTGWVVVPRDDMSNASLALFLGSEIYQAPIIFQNEEGKQRRGYISKLGHELVSLVETFMKQNDWADFEIYKQEENKQKEGHKYTKFSFSDLKKGRHRRRITTWLKEKGFFPKEQTK